MSDEPQITDAELQTYADGRLGEERSRAVEAWLAARPDDAERIAAYRRLGEELRRAYDPVLDEPLPAWLSDARGPRKRWQGFARVAGWAALSAVLGAFAGWELRDARPVAASRGDLGAVMARRAAVAHAVYSPEVRHPVEVGADQEAHLVAWLSKRLGTQLRAPKLESVGYSLVGGRLLPGDNGPVAHFMYQSSQGSRITLYVRSDMTGNRETAFRYAREGNVGVFYWVDSKVGYAISSADISKDALLAIANAAYQQLNPP
jgi:anti-sigma factor RsiW